MKEDTSYLRMGVLPQASFRLTAEEGRKNPDSRSKPSAPPCIAADPTAWLLSSHQLDTAMLR